jgi:O-antigen/teichoic acid export membrane protein
MQWVKELKAFTEDHVRQTQFFLVCRQTGIILSSIVLARMMPIEDVGIIEMMMLCGYLLTFFWSDAVLRGYLATTKKEESGIASFLWLYVLLSIVSMAILFLGMDLWVPLFTSRSELQGLSLFVVYQALILPVWIAPFIGLLKGQNTSLLSLFVLIGPAFACWTGLMSLQNIYGALIGLFSYAVVGFVWTMSKSKPIRKLHPGMLIKAIWPATWPLILYALSTGLARSFDAWLVARYFDESDFAIYRYGAREFPLVMALSVGVSTMMIPLLHTGESLVELKRRSTRLMHIGYPVIILLMLVSPLVFTWVFGPSYKGSSVIFMIYLLISLTQFVFPQSILIARGESKLLWYVSIAELVVNVIASLVLMKYLGLAGIAAGTLVAFVFEKILLLILVRIKFGISLREIVDISSWLGYALIMVTAFFASVWLFGN